MRKLPTTDQWEESVDLRLVAPDEARCARCGVTTWQHQAKNICGECGQITQHEPPQAAVALRVKGVRDSVSPGEVSADEQPGRAA